MLCLDYYWTKKIIFWGQKISVGSEEWWLVRAWCQPARGTDNKDFTTSPNPNPNPLAIAFAFYSVSIFFNFLENPSPSCRPTAPKFIELCRWSCFLLAYQLPLLLTPVKVSSFDSFLYCWNLSFIWVFSLLLNFS